MKSNLTKYGFLLGLIGMIIEVLLIVLKSIEGNMIAQEIIYVEQNTTFSVVISENWACIVGTVLAFVLFFIRVLRGPETILELVAVMLWGIQLLGKFDSEMLIKDYVLSHIIGIVGVVLILAVALVDLVDYKKSSEKDEDSE